MVTANAGIGFTKRPLLNVEFVRAAYFAVACPQTGSGSNRLEDASGAGDTGRGSGRPYDVFKDVTAVCGPPTNKSEH